MNPENKTEEKKSFSISTLLRKLFEDFKKGIIQNYNILLLISVIFGILLYFRSFIYLDQISLNNKGVAKIIGGANEQNMMMSPNVNNGGKNGAPKKGKSIFSGGLGIMYWLAKNILLFYLLLIFITAIPSVPIILYITVLYFVMTSMFSKLNNI